MLVVSLSRYSRGIYSVLSLSARADRNWSSRSVRYISSFGRGKFIVIDWKKKSTGGPPFFIKKKESQVIEKCKKVDLVYEKEFDSGSSNKYGLIFSK